MWPARGSPDSSRQVRVGEDRGRSVPSGVHDEGSPHALVLVDLPVRPVDLVAREEVGARGVDDEPEQEGVSGVHIVVDARLRTANAAQVRPGIVVTGVLVDGGIADCLVVLIDRKSTRLNSSHRTISYAVFC